MNKQSATTVPIDIEFYYQGGTLSAKITATVPLPLPPPLPAPFPIKLDAHEWRSLTDSLVRWQADQPFILFPNNFSDWQKKGWPAIPDAGIWLLAPSKPDGHGKHYLELWTRTSATQADYWVFPAPQGGALRSAFRALQDLKPGMVNALRQVLEKILSSDAVNATIIISE
jgi:hypothetical protein